MNQKEKCELTILLINRYIDEHLHVINENLESKVSSVVEAELTAQKMRLSEIRDIIEDPIESNRKYKVRDSGKIYVPIDPTSRNHLVNQNPFQAIQTKDKSLIITDPKGYVPKFLKEQGYTVKKFDLPHSAGAND